MAANPEVRLQEIRSFEGSQARAWEELTYQLRPGPGHGHIETRKTRAPDGGVEWYEVYADGHSEGFQAKFNSSLEDALGEMTESVKAVAAKRPTMTRLTFVVPYDFTDSGEGKTTTDQDRWERRVHHWRGTIPGADRLELAVIRGGDVLEELTRAKHAGRRAYWFGGVELSPEWLEQRWADARALAGPRYTPEADTPTVASGILHSALLTPRFRQQLRAAIQHTLDSCQPEPGLWDEDESVRTPLARLQSWLDTTLTQIEASDETKVRLPQQPPDFHILSEILSELRDGLSQDVPRSDRRYSALQAGFVASQVLLSFGKTRALGFANSRVTALAGPAGQGKTHTLVHAARELLDQGVPAIVVLAERFDDNPWWSSLSAALGGINGTSDEFMAALDSVAEASGGRAALIIDALNEARSPKRWLIELPSLVAAVKEHPHVALIVSFRSDYQELVLPEGLMHVHSHLGLAGNEQQALENYCRLFNIAIPSTASLDAAFTSPLFLRMYCQILADEEGMGLAAPTRSNLFERYTGHRTKSVVDKLDLPPTSQLVRNALNYVCDQLLANQGRPIARSLVESHCETLAPDRAYPMTLFKQMATEGVIELLPGVNDSGEQVTLAFQAYSEHLLAKRLLDTIGADSTRDGTDPIDRVDALARRLEGDRWLWRAFAVTLPEREGVELIDVLPETLVDSHGLQTALRESFADRDTKSFSARTIALLQDRLDTPSGVDIAIRLATRRGHPGNADWLHEQLTERSLPDRDASWTIAAFDVEDDSPAYRRLTTWATTSVTPSTSTEEVRLAALLLMWLLTSSNRYLRDGASRTLSHLVSQRLEVAASLLASARDTDDPYVHERVITCVYGAVINGGATDTEAVTRLLNGLKEWRLSGLPINALARDSAVGIAAWAHWQGLATIEDLATFKPPYGAPPPEDPPTKNDLEANYGLVKVGDEYRDWRAYSILSSCLTWMGDFNKYVIKGDVDTFSQLPLAGPPPRDWRDPRNEVEADWAGRWVANRAIAFGWTPERFAEFESSRDLHSGRDSHKAERIGKKYQWIALHELLARLSDNRHMARQSWDDGPSTYEGPWSWGGRDFDPTLPPAPPGGPRTCTVAATQEKWPWLDLDIEGAGSPNDWVAQFEDLPLAEAVFKAGSPQGQQWVSLARGARWSTQHRAGARSRERHVSLHLIGWLVPNGTAQTAVGLVSQKLDHALREARKPHGQYLGELAWSPIARSRGAEDDVPSRLKTAGIAYARHATEQWVWEGTTRDCSIDNTLDIMMPSDELLGDATWVPGQAAWEYGGRVVCRSLEEPGTGQTVVVADADWLNGRLQQLDSDVVLAAFGERQYMPDADGREIAWSEFSYFSTWGSYVSSQGPIMAVRRRLPEGDMTPDASSSVGSVVSVRSEEPAAELANDQFMEEYLRLIEPYRSSEEGLPDES